MEEAPENGKKLSHSAHTNGVDEYNHLNTIKILLCRIFNSCTETESRSCQKNYYRKRVILDYLW
jgi:hypothetical protein